MKKLRFLVLGLLCGTVLPLSTSADTITYNLDGGVESLSNPTTYTVESGTFGLYQPTKTGYMFLGWTGSNGSTPNANVYISAGSTGDKTYNAVWGDFEDINAYFISETGVVSHITLMDRNMGANSNDITSTGSYGFHYQWGNNNGFQIGCWTNGCKDSTSANATGTKAIWNSSYNNKGYNGTTLIKAGDDYWAGNQHYDGLWGGGGDSQNNNWGLNAMTAENITNRQGPCPAGYHVPSDGEWKNIYEKLGLSSDAESIARLQNVLNISFAGYHVPASWIGEIGTHVNHWSSTPRSSTYNGYGFYLYSFNNGFYINRHASFLRVYASPVRCFSNDYLFSQPSMTIQPNGGTGAMIIVEGNSIKLLGTPIKTDREFIGWYSDVDFTNKIEKGDLVPNKLYAKWGCKNGYEENEENTDCLIKTYSITYNLNGGVNNTNNPGIYTVETPTITLQDATRDGSIFLGRYSSAELSTKKETITQGSTGDIILYAKWGCEEGYIENEEKTTCEKIRVEFDANGGDFSVNSGTYNVFPNYVSKDFISTKIEYTPNLTNEGEYRWRSTTGGNPDGCAPAIGSNVGEIEIYRRLAEYIQIEGVNNLKVSVKYGGSSYGTTCAGPIGIRTGNHTDYEPRNPNHSGSAIRYLSKFPAYGTFGIDEFVVQGDSITIVQSEGCPNYGWYAIITGTSIVRLAEYSDDAFDNIPEPSREGHKFVGWYLSDDTEFDTGSVSTGEITYVYAKWECAEGYVDKQGQCVKEETKPSGGSSGGGGGGGGGGSSSSSCKNLPANAVANNSSTPSSNTNYYYSTNTSKVCTFQCKSGYTRNAEKETCDKASDTQTTSGKNVKEPEANTGNNTEIQTGSKIDTQPAEQAPEQTPQNDNSNIQDSSTSSQNDGKTYTQEFQEAYEFAHENGITTKNTIQSADMNGKLTRIAMAKMLSQYAINVLGKTPDTTQNNKFNDVTDKRDADYDNGVTLAYQLGIMGQNMPGNNFRPDDEVSRAEFATALSRMLYNTSDGQYKSTDKYYTNHMSKLVKEGIITKDDPKMKELRGYVMIMLMRSSK